MNAPEQQLRAYVDYLRDLGIYDLYRFCARAAGSCAYGCCSAGNATA